MLEEKKYLRSIVDLSRRADEGCDKSEGLLWAYQNLIRLVITYGDGHPVVIRRGLELKENGFIERIQEVDVPVYLPNSFRAFGFEERGVKFTGSKMSGGRRRVLRRRFDKDTAKLDKAVRKLRGKKIEKLTRIVSRFLDEVEGMRAKDFEKNRIKAEAAEILINREFA